MNHTAESDDEAPIVDAKPPEETKPKPTATLKSRSRQISKEPVYPIQPVDFVELVKVMGLVKNG